MPTTVDYSGASVTVPGYTVTLSGVAADRDRLALTVTVDHDFPVPNTENRRVGNAMLWIDGKLAAQLWGPACPGQSFTYDAPGPTGCRVTISITIDRAAVDIIPGGRELVLSLWPQSAPAQTPIPYLRVTLDVPARPRPVLAAGRFTRALFWTDPNEVLSDPALAAAIVAAGVTHLTCGVFTNPADSGNPSEDYATWRSSWLPWITGRLTLLQQHSLRLHAAGDDFLRSPAERAWLNSTDWAPQAVVDVATVLRDSGVCDALAAVDEINGTPTDDPAYARFVQAWRSVPGAPPLGWPAPGAASPPYPFEVPAYADYADRYWSDLDFRPGRGDSSITTASLAAELARVGSQVGCPPFAWTCLVSAMGALYTKQAAGGDYQPGIDLLQKGGVRGPDVAAQIWLAVILGAAGVRVYAYDAAFNRDPRAAAPIGATDLQTGVRPGDDRWPWLAAAFLAVAAREAEIATGHRWPTEACGPVVTGGRGTVRVAVNTAATPAPLAPRAGAALVTASGEVPYAGPAVPAAGVVLWPA